MMDPTAVRDAILHPTVREVILYCENCKKEDKYFMTNQEIFAKTTTQAWCENCQKTTNKTGL